MQISELRTNVIVRGPVLPEPVQVIRVVPMGTSVKLVGRGCDFHHHLCSGMLYLHFFKNCNSIISDDNFICRGDNHFIHSFGSKSRFYNLCNHSCSLNIIPLCILSYKSLNIFWH